MVYRTTAATAVRKDAHRRKFIATAVHMFGRHGYHATTVPMIVRASKSSTGSFYFYFRNKEDVFAAALESLGERMAIALNDAIGKVADPLEQMKTAVMTLMSFLAANPHEARILIVESSGLTTRLETVRRGIIASHARSVQHALTLLADRLPPLDPAIVAHCWVGAVHQALYHWLELPVTDRISARNLGHEVMRFNLRGIGIPSEAL